MLNTHAVFASFLAHHEEREAAKDQHDLLLQTIFLSDSDLTRIASELSEAQYCQPTNDTDRLKILKTLIAFAQAEIHKIESTPTNPNAEDQLPLAA